ncbi:hypothetical protein DPMN_131764 [Dreissena polymorpha]|uniref:Uncharacterized protein n=1 Tax=Dreissena polymorpha TaxID=45954 RepID=A0A9D4FS22_DREPO|nr:hypothetical protein DPMN_131764 [Dreissena polymorpha]
MSRCETTSSRRPQFQTGMLVPHDNFRIPVIDTKAVQPSEDETEQGEYIGDIVGESHPQIGELLTQLTSALSRADSFRAPVQPQQSQKLESLMRSDASAIVQSMGYDALIVRQALSGLLEKGETQPNAQAIMNEIFQIEDRTLNA